MSRDMIALDQGFQTPPHIKVLADVSSMLHGRSLIWRELKDFVQDRLYLQWDEFNRVSSAGIATAARLLKMLDDAAFAFLVLTGEDETAEGALQARMSFMRQVYSKGVSD
jgi:hypothetical protein